MADQNQFEEFEGEPGFAAQAAARPEGCAVCEAMLPDAVDGGLSESEQRAFDRHVAGCAECARELAEAKRGAAWLAMLKTETPQPPVGMLERILAGTTGLVEAAPRAVAAPGVAPAGRSAIPPMRDEAAQEWGTRIGAAAFQVSGTRPGAPAPVSPEPLPEHAGTWARPVAPARQAVPAWALSSVWRRAVGAFRVENSRASFQPRLAMTAAMAFFSIALTLNLTGVRLRDLRASDFTPGGISRTVADASASATRSFQNLRVVYQVESRMSELRSEEASNENQEPSGGSGPSR